MEINLREKERGLRLKKKGIQDFLGEGAGTHLESSASWKERVKKKKARYSVLKGG